jgi:hypothetical protein
MGRLPLFPMDLVLAMSPSGKSVVVLLFTGVLAPIAGLLLRRIAGGWDSVGKGPFAPVDPAIQAAEVRQMLEAKASRRRRHGEPPIDVEAETTRLLAVPGEAPSAGARQDAELRTEVRQLVVSRNERRMRRGLEPLDVEAETERQLEDFVGSP